jgi:hypothetical protein
MSPISDPMQPGKAYAIARNRVGGISLRREAATASTAP